MNWVQINIQVNEEFRYMRFRYMKIHILLLLFYYFASTITEISQC